MTGAFAGLAVGTTARAHVVVAQHAIEHRGVLVSHAPNTHSRQSLTLKQPGRRIRRAIVHDGGPEKVELKPETLLAHAMHIAAADAAVERALRGDQPFS